MLPDLAKFHHLGKILIGFGTFKIVYLVFGKILNLLWQIAYAIGQMFININGQTLKK